MAISLVGRKLGMTQLFTEDGAAHPVSVVEVLPNQVSQIKSVETDGYSAIQVTAGKELRRVNKALAGHFAKAEVKARNTTREIRLEAGNESEYQLGQELKVDLFEEGQTVHVTGTSIGKGFAGVVKRWNFRTQDATHGNSLAHRAPGSIGQNQTPGRVFKGKKMAGHLGNAQCTTKNLTIKKIDSDNNLILIRGSIPGAPGSDVIIRSA